MHAGRDAREPLPASTERRRVRRVWCALYVSMPPLPYETRLKNPGLRLTMSARRVERSSWYESFSSDVGLCLSTHNMCAAVLWLQQTLGAKAEFF